MTLLVSGASLGVQLYWGAATVANVAQGAFEVGWDSSAYGYARVTFDAPARNLAFDLTVELTQDAGNVRLDFDLNRPISGAGIGLAVAFGTPGVENAAQGALATGWLDEAIGIGHVSFDAAARNLAFDFTASYTVQPALNVGLYFDGTPLVPKAGIVDLQEWIGTHLIYNNARFLYPGGIASAQVWGVPIAIRGELVNFDLTDAYTVQAATNVRLDFDPQRPVMEAGWSEFASGTPTVENAAQGAFAEGIDANLFGPSTIVSGAVKARNLLFEFVDSYTPDTGANIAFSFGNPLDKNVVGAGGIADLAFGAGIVGTDGKIYPVGFANENLYGTATVENLNRTVQARSIDAGRFGLASLIEIAPPSPHTLAPWTLSPFTAFGTAFLSGGLRWLDLSGRGGMAPGAFGTAFISFGVRYVDVPWFFLTDFGQAMVDFHHIVEPTGFNAGTIGEPWVHDWNQTLDMIGTDFASLEFGMAEVTRSPRHVYPLGFRTVNEDAEPSERWGLPALWNMRQYVEQLFAPGSEDGGVFGSYMWMVVENRNRTVQAYGHIDDRFPVTNLLDLAGRALMVQGFVAFDDDRVWTDRSLIAYAIRHVYPEPIEPFPVARWTVLTKTPEIFPVGVASGEAFGLPGVVNTRRYFDHLGGFDASEFGTAFIAPRVRGVEQYWPPEPKYGMPTIWNYTRYLEPPGMPTPGFGIVDAAEHHSIIAPRWPTRADLFGTEIRIRNLTPELHFYGAVQTEWGDTHIFLQWRRFQFEGWDSAQVSRGLVIKDRTQTIPVQNFLTNTLWGSRTQIHNLIPDPPTSQTVATHGGTATVFGGPVVHANSVYPEGKIMTEWGQAVVRSNGIFPDSIFNWDLFGTPTLNAQQTVIVIPAVRAGDYENWIAARVDPYTIWCWEDPPEQAMRCNPGGPFKRIDEDVLGTSDRPAFGSARVDLKNRRLYPDSFGPTEQIGDETWASNRVRYLTPNGIRAYRAGFPRMNDDREINLDRFGRFTGSFGNPTVDFPDLPYTRTIIPQGIGIAFGRTQVDLFNRELALAGWESDLWGTARVHPPEPIVPQGFDATLYGDTMVDFKIRHLTPAGWEEFIAQETIGFFKDRMRVKRG